MIITIAGNAGSGKSTIAKEVAKTLQYKHYSTGDKMRSMAKKRGVSILKLNQLGEKDPSIDKEIDTWLENLGKKKSNFIIDSRLGFHFIPLSFKVFLKSDFNVRMERIFNDKRVSEEHNTLGELKKFSKEREKSELKRYKKLYNVNYYKEKNYDLVIDTSNLSVKKIVERVVRKSKKHEK